jgi:hypothetical protein
MRDFSMVIICMREGGSKNNEVWNPGHVFLELFRADQRHMNYRLIIALRRGYGSLGLGLQFA